MASAHKVAGSSPRCRNIPEGRGVLFIPKRRKELNEVDDGYIHIYEPVPKFITILILCTLTPKRGKLGSFNSRST